MKSTRVQELTVVLASLALTGLADSALAAEPIRPTVKPAKGLPTIFLVTPSLARPGQSVVVLGTNFFPNPKVVIGGAQVAPTVASPVGLIFTVPSALGTTGCQSAVSVAIKTARGVSAPTSFAVRERDPRLDPIVGDISVGRALVVTGSGLARARFTLGGRPLTVNSSTERQAVVAVPKDQPLGFAVLVVSSPCGRDAARVRVISAPPAIVRLEPAQVAPQGILEVTTDVVDPALITSAEIGSTIFPATDPDLFRVVPRRNPTDPIVIALRISSDTAPGQYALRLKGPTGTSDEKSVEVALPRGPLPPSPVQACHSVFNKSAELAAENSFATFAAFGFHWFTFPSFGADDETLPLGSGNDGGLLSLTCHIDPAEQGQWYYDFTDLGEGRQCRPTGKFAGYEVYCTSANGCQMPPDRSLIYRSVCRSPENMDLIPNVRCFPLTGTYEFNAGANRATITIDRGDGPEEYVGGWGRGDEMAQPVAGEARRVSAQLVLRSKRTGLQLSIGSDIRPKALCEKQ